MAGSPTNTPGRIERSPVDIGAVGTRPPVPLGRRPARVNRLGPELNSRGAYECKLQFMCQTTGRVSNTELRVMDFL